MPFAHTFYIGWSVYMAIPIILIVGAHKVLCIICSTCVDHCVILYSLMQIGSLKVLVAIMILLLVEFGMLSFPPCLLYLISAQGTFSGSGRGQRVKGGTYNRL